jgi:Flp pilus assembly protein TadD
MNSVLRISSERIAMSVLLPKAAPSGVEPLINQGVALAEQGRLEEATAKFRAATLAWPDSAKAHLNYGVALAQQGKPGEAAHHLRAALQLRADYPEAHYNLGNVQMAQAKHAEAIRHFEEAVRRKPDYYEAYNNLGLELTEVGRLGEAAVILRQAVRLRPDMPEPHSNLGLALEGLGRFAEAEACHYQALRINPHYAEAHANLAGVYRVQGRLEEAAASYEQALRLQPDSASTHWNQSLVLLQMGRYADGWRAYEWRWRRKQSPPRRLSQPLWDGSALEGRTILLHMEQGLGDMIQFIRYAPLVKKCGGIVLVECPSSLIPLFSRCSGIDQLLSEGRPLRTFHVYAPLLSLPCLLGTAVENIPASVPYLSAEPTLVEDWRSRLAEFQEFKIGIAWQGNLHHKWDRYRSFALAQFASLARVPGVRLISLQKGSGVDQLRQAVGRFPVTELPGPLDESTGAFMDTAAILKNLDLVITPDTALAHLAGALGVRVWVALSVIVDWRWFLEREDSPWYPTMRLFRQTRLGDWAGIFDQMTHEVRRLLRPSRIAGDAARIATG